MSNSLMSSSNPPIYQHQSKPSQSTPVSMSAPPRLRSPIQLSSPVTPVKRRKRRPLARVDFDHLPWISALHSPPDPLCDIADLSQIQFPLPNSASNQSPLPNSLSNSPIPASGPGPVRRRKTSLRSNPLAFQSSSPDHISSAAGSYLPFCDTATPPPRFIPSRVLFRNLMPVYNDQSDDCSFPRPLLT